MYASSLSKEGSRKDGTVLELRPGRIHAGGHSSYVPLRTIRFPSLDGEPDDAAIAAATQQQQPSQPPQQPQRPQSLAHATNGSSHLKPPAHLSLRPAMQASQPSPTQQPIALRTDSDGAGSPDAVAPAVDDPALAVRNKVKPSLCKLTK